MQGEAKRDPRRATFLKVYVRSDNGWSEAVLCNVSAHGMMLRGDDLPRRGNFIEIDSGTVTVVGQVRWALAGRCGIRTREAVDLGALLGDHPQGERHSAPAGPVVRYAAGPRSRPATDSKAMARALDFGLTVALLAGGAWLLGTTVTGLFGTPLEQVKAELAPHRPAG
jgi:hypothetical protein